LIDIVDFTTYLTSLYLEKIFVEWCRRFLVMVMIIIG